MGNAVLAETDAKVLDALAAEIDSIKVDSGVSDTVSYSPEAFTREGRTD